MYGGARVSLREVINKRARAGMPKPGLGVSISTTDLDETHSLRVPEKTDP